MADIWFWDSRSNKYETGAIIAHNGCWKEAEKTFVF